MTSKHRSVLRLREESSPSSLPGSDPFDHLFGQPSAAEAGRQRQTESARYTLVPAKATIKMLEAGMSVGDVNAEIAWGIWYTMLAQYCSDEGRTSGIFIQVPVKPSLSMLTDAQQSIEITTEAAWKIWSEMVQQGAKIAHRGIAFRL